MSHLENHLFQLGCIRRGSSEENEMAHNEFKSQYPTTNKHMDAIATQLLPSWVCHPLRLAVNAPTKSVPSPHVAQHVT